MGLCLIIFLSQPEEVANVELQYAIQKRDENGRVINTISKDYRAMGITNKVKYIFRYDDDSLRENIVVCAR